MYEPMSPLVLVVEAVAGARAGRPVDVGAVRAAVTARCDQLAATAAETGADGDWAAFGRACGAVLDALDAGGPSAALLELNGALRALTGP